LSLRTTKDQGQGQGLTSLDNIEIKESFSSSDHNIIYWNLNCKTEMPLSNVVKYNYSRADYTRIALFLKEIDWELKFQDIHVDKMWDIFCEILNEVIVTYIPKMTNKSKKFPVWMTKEARKLRKNKVRMWKRYKEDKCYNNKMEYKLALNKVTTCYKTAKAGFESKLASNVKKNPKAFYNYVRSNSKTKEKVGPLKDETGNVISDSSGMCKLLNNYFSSIFTIENVERIPEARPIFIGDHENKLQDIDLKQSIIYEKLKSLKPHKAAGVDNLDSDFLSKVADVISYPLTKIFTKSLESGTVPTDWKQANVCAIFKKGQKALPENYRPVSLTSHVCKMFESIVKDNIVAHIEKYDLLNSSQHGFVKGKSCLTNLLEFITFVSDCIDGHKDVDVIYLEFQKAFDKVPHKRLLSKVKSFGITGKVSNWIEKWLLDRKQRVVLNGSFSEWKSVTSGVPQGSVLGPLLFIMFVDDMNHSVVSNLLKFADDAKLFRCVSDPGNVDVLKDDLNSLYRL